jgi:Pol polyprotein
MGNNASCKVMGIGFVRVKMFDGILRTLRNVRHVLDMKKNLISLGALYSNVCKCILEKGVLRLTLGAQVVMKGKKV